MQFPFNYSFVTGRHRKASQMFEHLYNQPISPFFPPSFRSVRHTFSILDRIDRSDALLSSKM